MKVAKKLINMDAERLLNLIKDNDVFIKFIKDEIANMKTEIESSIPGKRSGTLIDHPEKGKGYTKYIDTTSKSTFPTYLQDIFDGNGTTKRFLSAVRRGRGPVWDKISIVAVERLLHGYRNFHGYNGPDQEFHDALQDPNNF